jgi:hypothetical protein
MEWNFQYDHNNDNWYSDRKKRHSYWMKGIIRFLSDYVWCSERNLLGVGLSVFAPLPFFFDNPLQAIEFYSAGETTWLFYYYWI